MLQQKTYERNQWAIVRMGSLPPLFLSEIQENGDHEFSLDRFILSEDEVLIDGMLNLLRGLGLDVESIRLTDEVTYTVN